VDRRELSSGLQQLVHKESVVGKLTKRTLVLSY
jgi:hypothetical protein